MDRGGGRFCGLHLRGRGIIIGHLIPLWTMWFLRLSSRLRPLCWSSCCLFSTSVAAAVSKFPMLLFYLVGMVACVSNKRMREI